MAETNSPLKVGHFSAGMPTRWFSISLPPLPVKKRFMWEKIPVDRRMAIFVRTQCTNLPTQRLCPHNPKRSIIPQQLPFKLMVRGPQPPDRGWRTSPVVVLPCVTPQEGPGARGPPSRPGSPFPRTSGNAVWLGEVVWARCAVAG